MTREQTHKPPTEATLDAFVRIVGEDNAIRDAQAMAPYLVEWRDRYRGKAALVLKPGETEEVAAILTHANATRTAIVPQGGNTGLVGGQIPFESGHEVVVALERLNRVRDIDLASNTMTVEAGLVLAHAQQVASSAGRLFPLSLASEGSCQIGGALATNAGGTSVLAYGNARELTLGIEVVLADGRIWDGLKSLRKDNSGYDLKDLFIGSEGTLGIITAAVLRLFPKPAEKVTAMAGLSDLEMAPAFFARVLERAGSCLTGFEIMPRMAPGLVMARKNVCGIIPVCSNRCDFCPSGMVSCGDLNNRPRPNTIRSKPPASWIALALATMTSEIALMLKAAIAASRPSASTAPIPAASPPQKPRATAL